MTELALVQDSQDAVENYRAAFARGLDELDAWFKADPASGRIQGHRNATAVLSRLSRAKQPRPDRAIRGACAVDWPNSGRTSKDSSSESRRRSARIRVGIVSAHVCDHSVWNAITKGWFQHLDQGRFELHAFSLGPRRDKNTEFAKSRAARFRERPPTARQWAEAILAEPLDVLIYPEIGMDPMTAKLACLRLAPVQVTTWGHPETSGLPTIDYYMSAAEFEPGGARPITPKSSCHSLILVAATKPSTCRTRRSTSAKSASTRPFPSSFAREHLQVRP